MFRSLPQLQPGITVNQYYLPVDLVRPGWMKYGNRELASGFALPAGGCIRE
jgi:hypothetical protein